MNLKTVNQSNEMVRNKVFVDTLILGHPVYGD